MKRTLAYSIDVKRLIGASMMLSLAFATSVGATTTSEQIKSRGNIEYDSNEDGAPDVLFCSEDLANVSNGLGELNVQVGELSNSFDELTNKTLNYKTDIINGLNSNVYAKDNLSDESGFSDIIDAINSIPARGDVNVILTNTEKTKTFPAGYYESFTVTSDYTQLDATLTYSHHVHDLETDAKSEENDSLDVTSVSAGYDDSYRSSVPGGCFTTPYYHVKYSSSYTVREQCGGYQSWHTASDGCYLECICSRCGHRMTAGMGSGWALGPCDVMITKTVNNSVDKWTTSPNSTESQHIVETVYICSCGKKQGQVTDVHLHYN
ncbi:hypothetical protein [Butyrivibrio hungatei]|uniref:Uncharacterized protein n=1 Tax=Butyrivibrio hungatei TaxID=185008 RepID=A0A1D9P6P1_9FIRM|nr:hypothetical protein [Butyrivibrio hungatei]AOZ97825.1 hypothetical protein bhn_II026 [Butyrivibrio hungatei]